MIKSVDRAVLSAAFLAGLCAVTAAHADSPKPDAAVGAKLYAANCATCHMADGSGGKAFGDVKSANLQAPDLEKTYHNSDKLLLRAILYALDEDGQRLDKPMPVWHGKLTDAQGRDILAYLKMLHG